MIIARHVLIVGLLAALSAAATVPIPAHAEEEPPKGYYHDYLFDMPQDPSEAWLLAYGGRIYDMWWAVLQKDPPRDAHPLYPPNGEHSDIDSWRCVTCHGWDYRGSDGPASANRPKLRIKGIDGMAGADPGRVATVVRDDRHQYTAAMISDSALEALALFVSRGQHEAARYVASDTGLILGGDPEHGRAIFQNLCAICHDYDGSAWISGESDELQTLGAVAVRNPWQALHKLRNGQPSADMPAMRAFDMQVLLDVLSHAQTLPIE